MKREEQICNKAKELGQTYFPDASNIWARGNIEAEYVEHACIEMARWLDAHPNWISVKDELPKADGQYIIASKYGYVSDLNFNTESKRWWLRGKGYMDGDYVTHWMSLPTPPRKEGKQ